MTWKTYLCRAGPRLLLRLSDTTLRIHPTTYRRTWLTSETVAEILAFACMCSGRQMSSITEVLHLRDGRSFTYPCLQTRHTASCSALHVQCGTRSQCQVVRKVMGCILTLGEWRNLHNQMARVEIADNSCPSRLEEEGHE